MHQNLTYRYTLTYRHGDALVGEVAEATGSLLMVTGSGKTFHDDVTGGSKTSRVTNIQKQESPIWENLEPARGRDLKTKGLGKDKKFFKWDHTHNDIEVFDHTGRHLGSMHPVTNAASPFVIMISRHLVPFYTWVVTTLYVFLHPFYYKTQRAVGCPPICCKSFVACSYFL
jgi:hypothetical protein